MSFIKGNVEFVKKIDEFIDGNIDGADGNLRWYISPSANYYVFLILEIVIGISFV